MAARFGITEIICDGAPGQGAGEERAEARAEWDRRNRLALEKLRFFVSVRVDQIVTDGEELTAWQYYQRLHRLFLRMGEEMYQHCIYDWRFASIRRRRSVRVGCTVRCNIRTISSSWGTHSGLG